MSTERMALTSQGNVCYTLKLKTPYRDGTTHILLEPVALLPHREGHPGASPVGGPRYVVEAIAAGELALQRRELASRAGIVQARGDRREGIDQRAVEIEDDGTHPRR